MAGARGTPPAPKPDVASGISPAPSTENSTAATPDFGLPAVRLQPGRDRVVHVGCWRNLCSATCYVMRTRGSRPGAAAASGGNEPAVAACRRQECPAVTRCALGPNRAPMPAVRATGEGARWVSPRPPGRAPGPRRTAVPAAGSTRCRTRRPASERPRTPACARAPCSAACTSRNPAACCRSNRSAPSRTRAWRSRNPADPPSTRSRS